MVDEPPLGNLVCEVEEGRLIWTLYRYRRSFIPGSQYSIGPDDRRHGFYPPMFFSDAVYPFAFRDWGGVHIFQKEFQPLTPEAVQDLYAAALALPNEV
jgi:hypothetical protein